jgi:hypothetical protein
MDVFSKRCGCGQVFKLVSLKARTTQCEGCARKGALSGPIQARLGSLNNPIEVTIKPRVNGVLLPPGHNPYRDAKAAWERYGQSVRAPLRDSADPLHSLGVYELNGRDPRAVAAAGALCSFVAGLGQSVRAGRWRLPRHLRAHAEQLKGEWYRAWPEAAPYHDQRPQPSPGGYFERELAKTYGPPSYIPRSYFEQVQPASKRWQPSARPGTLEGLKSRTHQLVMQSGPAYSVEVREDVDNYTVYVDVQGFAVPAHAAGYEWHGVAERLRDQLTGGIGLILRVNGTPIDW